MIQMVMIDMMMMMIEIMMMLVVVIIIMMMIEMIEVMLIMIEMMITMIEMVMKEYSPFLNHFRFSSSSTTHRWVNAPGILIRMDLSS